MTLKPTIGNPAPRLIYDAEQKTGVYIWQGQFVALPSTYSSFASAYAAMIFAINPPIPPIDSD